MKKILSLLAFIFATAIATAQSEGQKRGWSKAYRDTTLSACVKAAHKSLSLDSARNYCSCAIGRLEIMFPNQADADKITTADMEQPKFKEMIKECLAMKWPEKDRKEFINSCIANATSLKKEKATQYCNCMLIKLEAKFINPEDAGTITAEEMAKPEWQKAIKGCLEQ